MEWINGLKEVPKAESLSDAFLIDYGRAEVLNNAGNKYLDYL
jgi:hypothetical protein